MMSAQAYIRDLARKAAENRLHAAASFLEAQAPAVLFRKPMRTLDGTVVTVNFYWPGVLVEQDAETGEIVAQTPPGKAADRPHTAAFIRRSLREPLIQRTMRVARGSFHRVRFEWPGVLRVVDARTGETLAESQAGHPYQLKSWFVHGPQTETAA